MMIEFENKSEKIPSHVFLPLNVKIVGMQLFSHVCSSCGNFVNDEHRDDPCPGTSQDKRFGAGGNEAKHDV